MKGIVCNNRKGYVSFGMKHNGEHSLECSEGLLMFHETGSTLVGKLLMEDFFIFIKKYNQQFVKLYFNKVFKNVFIIIKRFLCYEYNFIIIKFYIHKENIFLS